jgi:hypothetical protein
VEAHLWAWQQISIARIQGGIKDQEPELPKWIVDSVEYWEEEADQVNALTFERNHQHQEMNTTAIIPFMSKVTLIILNFKIPRAML